MHERLSANSPEDPESQQILTKLGLITGAHLKIEKISAQQDSGVAIGKALEGNLKKEVKIGQPIEFENGGGTSNIVSIKNSGGRYFIQAQTSIYEIKNLKPETQSILDFKSFTTERGSIYNIGEDGKVQRIKTVLNDPNYLGDDKGEKTERKPSDIILFANPDSKAYGWLNDIGATRGEKTIAQSIDVGIYKEGSDGKYALIKTNKDLNPPFIFIRVNDDDSFKLRDVLTLEELKDFAKRMTDPQNRGVGVIIESGLNLSNTPVLGYTTFDYRYDQQGKIASMHNGNKVTSVATRK